MFPYYIFFDMGRGSAVGIEIGFELEDQVVGVQVRLGSKIFSFPRCLDRLSGPMNILSNGYRGLFLWR
jgi:hypothetical protein